MKSVFVFILIISVEYSSCYANDIKIYPNAKEFFIGYQLMLPYFYNCRSYAEKEQSSTCEKYKIGFSKKIICHKSIMSCNKILPSISINVYLWQIIFLIKIIFAKLRLYCEGYLKLDPEFWNFQDNIIANGISKNQMTFWRKNLKLR